MSHSSGLEGPSCLGSRGFSVACGSSRHLHAGELLKPGLHLSFGLSSRSVRFSVNTLFCWSFLSPPTLPDLILSPPTLPDLILSPPHTPRFDTDLRRAMGSRVAGVGLQSVDPQPGWHTAPEKAVLGLPLCQTSGSGLLSRTSAASTPACFGTALLIPLAPVLPFLRAQHSNCSAASLLSFLS